jgi:predicted TIM-barrel fold metal-dependent hydrolase
MPYVLERVDNVFRHSYAWANLDPAITDVPSSYVRGHVYGCFFDDMHGLESRDTIGIDQITFETDYPHQDSTWSHTPDVIRGFASTLTPTELDKILRTNAMSMLGLDRTTSSAKPGAA